MFLFLLFPYSLVNLSRTHIKGQAALVMLSIKKVMGLARATTNDTSGGGRRVVSDAAQWWSCGAATMTRQLVVSRVTSLVDDDLARSLALHIHHELATPLSTRRRAHDKRLRNSSEDAAEETA